MQKSMLIDVEVSDSHNVVSDVLPGKDESGRTYCHADLSCSFEWSTCDVNDKKIVEEVCMQP